MTSSILSRFPLTDIQHAAAASLAAAISVTAGAGSGKTRALVGRYLALLEAGLPLRSLVAITFTDKAAREMRNRVRAEITAWLAQAPAEQRDKWAAAFSALDAARISTIHSLCAAILRAHPAEAGLDPAFDVLEEGQSAVWQARAVEESLAWAAADPDAARLFSVWPEGQLRRLLAGLLAKCLDAAHILSTLPVDPLPLWTGALVHWLSSGLSAPVWLEALAALTGLQAHHADDKLELARREVLACWDNVNQAQTAQDWEAVFAALLALRAAIVTGGQKGNWAADDLTAVREAMAGLRDHFDQALKPVVHKDKPPRWALDQQAAALWPLAQRVFSQTQAIYQSYKDEARTLDFDDLEQLTAHLLAQNEAVRIRWQREINAVLLVDEFQDTNQRQREIVYALTGFGERQEPAKQPATLPTSLFVVGDAKQSIYRFRGADVTVFRQVQQDIQAAGGALLNFDVTFRAHQPLVELTNALLAPLMPATDDPARPYDVPFAPLTAFRSEPRSGMRTPYLEFLLGLGEDKETGRRAAAAALAGRLHELRRSGQLEWQDVALLFRASTAFGIYEDALEQAGIPFITVAGRGFYDRPEIRDLLNGLAALADPTDDLAMAGLLRSPSLGLSDAALSLLRCAENGQHRSFWPALRSDAILAALSPDDRQRANFARQVIDTLHVQAGRVTVAQLLKAFLDATYYRAALHLAPGGERMRRNVDKLLADAHRSEMVSIAEFLEYVTTLEDIGVRESEAPTEAGGAVQLMTIHKAKGLEFPVVILADAGYTGGAHSAPFYLDRELGLLLNPSGDESCPALFRLAAHREGEQEEAEERRLLYVAATRAREKLIISGNVRLSTAKSSPGKLMLGGWLSQLDDVVGLTDTQLPPAPTTPQPIPLAWAGGEVSCIVSPLPEPAAQSEPESIVLSMESGLDLPDLLPPLTDVPGSETDEKLKERDSDPPSRVWRVAPATPYDVPAWVVGHLTHLALRYWRFPDQTGFNDFLRPFALEAGLTDPVSIETALTRAAKLLTRFQAHPLYTELDTAERYHELPYNVTLDGWPQYGIIDLLFRSAPGVPWTIADFKTDRLAEGADLATYAQQKGYLRQVETYRLAVAQQLGDNPAVVLVFLNVGQAVQVFSP